MSLLTTLKFILNHPLNEKRKAKAIIGVLKWQIGSRLVPGEVIYNWVNASKFIVRVGEQGLTQNIYCGLHEFQDMAYTLHVLNSEDLFIDVGANVGSYTILACAVRGAKGICFEPVPSTYQRLMDNIRLNNLDERVVAYNFGLSDKEGEILFTSDFNTTNHVVASGELTKNTIKLKVLPLDTLLENKSPSLIKIDVEGFETLVLNGMCRTLRASSLHSVIMEVNGSGKRYGFNDEDLIHKMFAFGFKLYRYEPFKRKLYPLIESDYGKGNLLFLRNEDFINQRLKNSPTFKINSFEI